MGDRQEPELDHVRGGEGRHADGAAPRHQVRHRELPRPLQEALQVHRQSDNTRLRELILKEAESRNLVPHLCAYVQTNTGFHRFNVNFFAQLRRSALRRGEGVQQVGGVPARGQLRGQPLPQLVERRLRGRRVAVRAVQLGCQAPRQRQRSTQAGKGQVGEPQVRKEEVL